MHSYVAPPATATARWLPWAWTILFFVSNHKFTTRDTAAAASGDATIQIVIEILAYGAVGLFAADTWSRLGRNVPRSLVLRLFATYGLLCTMSSLWSVVPLLTLVRSGQVLVLVFLSALTAEVWSRGVRNCSSDWNHIWAAFASLTVILVISGFIWPNPYQGRFAWPGAHTTIAASYLVFSIIVLLSNIVYAPRNSVTRARRWALVALATGLSGILLLTITRAMLMSALLGLALMIASRTSKGRPSNKVVLGVVALVVLALAANAWSDSLLPYILRGQTVSDVTEFSGRGLLWSEAMQLLRSSPIVGFGYGASRVMLNKVVPWAAGGHNLWVEIALGLGALGALLVTTLLLVVLMRTRRLHRYLQSPLSSTAMVLVSIHLVAGVSGETVALPGLMLSSLGLIIATSVALEKLSNRPGERSELIQPSERLR